MHKPNILFLECGSSGHGGSFRSLKEHIEIVRDQFAVVIIVLVNDSVFEEVYKKLDCLVIKLSHPLYTKGARLLGLYNKGFGLIRRITPSLIPSYQAVIERRFINQLSHLIDKYEIDLIHLNNQPLRNYAGFIAAQKKQINVIAHIRTLHTYGINKYLIKNITRNHPQFIAISHAVQQEWKQYGIDSTVVYNPVAVNHTVHTGITKKYDLIYVGRLVKGKGVESLIAALARLNGTITLAIVGDGPLQKKLIEQVHTYQLNRYITFLGYQNDPLTYIAQSRILVLPTENEGLGRVLIEAMKIGVPVIANRTGGVGEIVEHKVTGFLYDSSIAGDLESKIVELLDSPTKLEQFSITGRDYANTKFSSALYVKQINLIISTLLSR